MPNSTLGDGLVQTAESAIKKKGAASRGKTSKEQGVCTRVSFLNQGGLRRRVILTGRRGFCGPGSTRAPNSSGGTGLPTRSKGP